MKPNVRRARRVTITSASIERSRAAQHRLFSPTRPSSCSKAAGKGEMSTLIRALVVLFCVPHGLLYREKPHVIWAPDGSASVTLRTSGSASSFVALAGGSQCTIRSARASWLGSTRRHTRPQGCFLAAHRREGGSLVLTPSSISAYGGGGIGARTRDPFKTSQWRRRLWRTGRTPRRRAAHSNSRRRWWRRSRRKAHNAQRPPQWR